MLFQETKKKLYLQTNLAQDYVCAKYVLNWSFNFIDMLEFTLKINIGIDRYAALMSVSLGIVIPASQLIFISKHAACDLIVYEQAQEETTAIQFESLGGQRNTHLHILFIAQYSAICAT